MERKDQVNLSLDCFLPKLELSELKEVVFQEHLLTLEYST